jgi:hypothetical protein
MCCEWFYHSPNLQAANVALTYAGSIWQLSGQQHCLLLVAAQLMLA